LDLLKKYPALFLISILFIGLNSYFFFQDNYFLNAIPFALIIIYIAIYHWETAFLLVAFFTPLSVNLEEFTEGKIGLFLPTEPILFGLMLLVIIRHLQKPFIKKETLSHPITISLFIYLLWLLITSITSTNPLISFKFLLMKSWFIIPLLFLGATVFENKKNVFKFFWSLVIAMVVIMTYTLIRHYSYGFGEKEGHWVMEPFYKDHTIYGAGVAMNLFFILGLLRAKKYNPLVFLTLIIFLIINLLALYFSYTRGAWLSVVFALGVWFAIHYKIRFKYMLSVAAIAGITLFFSWDALQMRLAKNRAEHTTEDFSERLQSASNITSDASNLERLNRWDAAWRMFQERPIFGFGPATYAFEYAPYQDPDNLTIISTNFGDGGNAHSEYLGPLAETGFIGFLTVLLFVSLLFYCGIKLYIKMAKGDQELRVLLLFGILAASTYFFHGLLNNYLDTDKAAVPVYGLCALIIALETKKAVLNNNTAS
jgi:O-antigen ligase